jgi:hypothetical protein
MVSTIDFIMDETINEAMDEKHLLLLAETFAAHVNRGLLTITGWIGVHNRTFTQLKKTSARRIDIDTYAKAFTWFDANWPSDLDWPAEVERPSARRPARRRRAA